MSTRSDTITTVVLCMKSLTLLKRKRLSLKCLFELKFSTQAPQHPELGLFNAKLDF